MVYQKTLRALLLVMLSLGATFGSATAQPAQPTRRPLFVEINPPAGVAADLEPTVARQRFVRLNRAELDNARPGQKLTLNLFDDVTLTATLTAVTAGETHVWVGDIDNSELGQVFLVSTAGEVAGNVSLPEGLFQVRYAGEEAYVIQQVDDSQFPEELPPIEVSEAEARRLAEAQREPQAVEADAAADNGSVIDVLVVYTPAARSAQGGATAMLNLANLATAETNQSYANSGIAHRINLVFVGEVNYAETYNMNTDIERLRGANDGYMDEIHSLRNLYKADLVSLISANTQYCGLAYQMESVSSWYSEVAFSVVSRTCAAGYYSFAHEMGHNMGARHDWYVDNRTAPSSYSHGYVNLNGRWRTIMAYDAECQKYSFTCRRLPYWANPAVNYGGAAMGVRSGTSTACQLGISPHPACDADDHRTLNETAYTVANFRVRATPRPYWEYPHQSFAPLVQR